MRFESCTLISVKLEHHKNVVTVFKDFELSPLSGLRFNWPRFGLALAGYRDTER
jgi:hypothetical protein